MKVLSIREPFATLIKDKVKIYETRSFKTNYRGEIYIHASLALSKAANAKEAAKYFNTSVGVIRCYICRSRQGKINKKRNGNNWCRLFKMEKE